MIAVALSAAYFMAARLGEGLRLPILIHHAPAAAKRFFSVPDLRYYALADGIKWALEGRQTPFWSHPHQARPILKSSSRYSPNSGESPAFFELDTGGERE